MKLTPKMLRSLIKEALISEFKDDKESNDFKNDMYDVNKLDVQLKKLAAGMVKVSDQLTSYVDSLEPHMQELEKNSELENECGRLGRYDDIEGAITVHEMANYLGKLSVWIRKHQAITQKYLNRK